MRRLCVPRQQRRGTVVIIVLWGIAVAAIVTSSVQLFAQRQATLGRESLERVQSRWAARAGIEYTMEVMSDHTLRPRPDNAKAMTDDMWYVSGGDMLNASYTILHQRDGINYGGPMDEHSKININRAEERGLLLALDDMTLDVVDAIGDWMDEDNDVSVLGVERDYYQSLDSAYEPRNGPMRSIGEIELVAGIWPKYFRGEDWNLNGRLDPNENDSDNTFPPDQADNFLEAEWSERLTVYSIANAATASGQPRIHLKNATVEDLTARLDLRDDQAQAVLNFGKASSNSLSDLLFTPLGGSGDANSNNNSNPNGTGENQQSGRSGSQNRNQQQQQQQQQQQAGPAPLTDAQLRAVLAETCIEDPLDRVPGKMNLNSVPEDLLRDIIVFVGLDEAIADEIIYMRSSKPTGIVSVADLMQIRGITPEELRTITRRFDTQSSIFTICSRGRSWASGLEVEIVAVVDRSIVPVRILEYREQ